MWLCHSGNGPFLDDGGPTFAHHKLDTSRILPSIWHHGYWICLHGLHVIASFKDHISNCLLKRKFLQERDEYDVYRWTHSGSCNRILQSTQKNRSQSAPTRRKLSKMVHII